MASFVNKGNGSETVLGEMPCPWSPISSMVVMFAGGSNARCLSAFHVSLGVFLASSIRKGGIVLVGRVALVVFGPTT
jgi:hypothetical protein